MVTTLFHSYRNMNRIKYRIHRFLSTRFSAFGIERLICPCGFKIKEQMHFTFEHVTSYSLYFQDVERHWSFQFQGIKLFQCKKVWRFSTTARKFNKTFTLCTLKHIRSRCTKHGECNVSHDIFWNILIFHSHNNVFGIRTDRTARRSLW